MAALARAKVVGDSCIIWNPASGVCSIANLQSAMLSKRNTMIGACLGPCCHLPMAAKELCVDQDTVVSYKKILSRHYNAIATGQRLRGNSSKREPSSI